MTALDYLKVAGAMFVVITKWAAPALACCWAQDREDKDNTKYRDVVVRDLGCEPFATDELLPEFINQSPKGTA